MSVGIGVLKVCGCECGCDYGGGGGVLKVCGCECGCGYGCVYFFVGVGHPPLSYLSLCLY